MIKIFLKRWWIVLISCGISAGIAYACAGGWGEEYGVSNFAPEAFVDSAYSPFFYSDNYYYKIGYDDNQNTRFNDANVAEWSAYLNQKLSTRQLHYLLENASHGAIDSAVLFYNRDSKSLPDSMQSFEVFKSKKDEKIDNFLRYLSLAKMCETFAVNEIPNQWDYDAVKKNAKKFDATGINKNLQSELDKSTDIFMKERYWFQLVRSGFYNENPQDAINVFDQYEKSMPRNTMYYRTLSYTAGAYYKLKNFSKANYYFSRVYDECDELKPGAHFSFHPQEETDWNATLALCKNVNEKATLWQMLGVYYGDEKEAISQIYQLDPKSDKLDLLLARAVNRYEQKFSYSGSGSVDDLADTSSNNTNISVRNLIARIANAVKAECFYSSNLFYADKNNADNMKAFLNKPSKTPFEKLCVQLSSIKIDDIYEFQAIQLAFKDNVENAIKSMSINDSTGNTILPANPFNGSIKDCHDCDQAASQKIKYSKLSFLQKIKELKDKIAKGKDVYTNSMLLANAYYNISHYGNDRAFYECKILGSGQYSPFAIDSIYRGMLTDMKLPAKYYRLALKASQNDEQKAKCHYMLAKCERNEWYNSNFYNNEQNEFKEDFLISLSSLTEFKLLKQYPNTKFYKEAINECGYFEKYAASN